MKSLVYIALLLSALMVAASVDAVPDPPAVNPHTLDLKIGGLLEIADGCPEQSRYGVLPYLVPVPLQRVDFIEMLNAGRLSGQIAWVSAAGDPSPPVSL
jgi:hypothetical protein